MGYDSHEDIAFEVAKYSLMRRSSIPVEVIPLKRREFVKRGIYTRSQDPKQSTEFTYLRFLVPYLNNYTGMITRTWFSFSVSVEPKLWNLVLATGWAAFSDDDMLFLGDIGTLIDQIDDKYAIMCVQHDYKPNVTTKLAGKAQSVYPRKNWSSVVLYNCGHPANRCLDLEMVNRVRMTI